jgi:L-asparaginase/Glu-tRNA(Gln) amidotransferase subunit D
MKNILVVFTGGTIGSIASEGVIKPSGDAPFELIAEYQRRCPNAKDIRFKTIQPIRILSENLAPPAWKILIAAIEAEQPAQYDGIIVTHGTDTLAYTAAALGFYFHRLTRPMLLVSSDYPLAHPKANGIDNFICAVEFILNVREPGVFVPYRNQRQTARVHRGVRLASSPQLTGDFFSVRGQSYLEFDGHRFSRTGLSPVKPQAELPPLKAEFSSRILMLKPYPGLDYSHINLERTDAVLHDLYHSGTACTTERWGENHSLFEFIPRCRQQGIEVYLAPAFKSKNAYESTHFLLKEGAKMIWNMSIEAAYVKLMLAYGNFNDPIRIQEFIERDVAGEHVEMPDEPA